MKVVIIVRVNKNKKNQFWCNFDQIYIIEQFTKRLKYAQKT